MAYMPLEFIKPQLATAVDHPPPRAGWIHEVKHDGYRTLLIIERHKARYPQWLRLDRALPRHNEGSSWTSLPLRNHRRFNNERIRSAERAKQPRTHFSTQRIARRIRVIMMLAAVAVALLLLAIYRLWRVSNTYQKPDSYFCGGRNRSCRPHKPDIVFWN